jgi:hypothetical protein
MNLQRICKPSAELAKIRELVRSPDRASRTADPTALGAASESCSGFAVFKSSAYLEIDDSI